MTTSSTERELSALRQRELWGEGWRENASARLDRIIQHGDEFGDIANTSGDDLRDVVMVAVERIRRVQQRTVACEVGEYPANESMPVEERISLWLRAIQDDLAWMGGVVAGRGYPSPAEQVQMLSVHAMRDLHLLASDLGVELRPPLYDFDASKGYERLVSLGWTPPPTETESAETPHDPSERPDRLRPE